MKRAKSPNPNTVAPSSNEVVMLESGTLRILGVVTVVAR